MDKIDTLHVKPPRVRIHDARALTSWLLIEVCLLTTMTMCVSSSIECGLFEDYCEIHCQGE
jgi:hypothetical protein